MTDDQLALAAEWVQQNRRQFCSRCHRYQPLEIVTLVPHKDKHLWFHFVANCRVCRQPTESEGGSEQYLIWKISGIKPVAPAAAKHHTLVGKSIAVSEVGGVVPILDGHFHTPIKGLLEYKGPVGITRAKTCVVCNAPVYVGPAVVFHHLTKPSTTVYVHVEQCDATYLQSFLESK